MRCDLTNELHTNQWTGPRQLLRTAGPNKDGDGDGDRAFGTGRLKRGSGDDRCQTLHWSCGSRMGMFPATSGLRLRRH